jgi:hypothetical protein
LPAGGAAACAKCGALKAKLGAAVAAAAPANNVRRVKMVMSSSLVLPEVVSFTDQDLLI